jgi:4-hydroxy-tetrahydrodipicolinate reductase
MNIGVIGIHGQMGQLIATSIQKKANWKVLFGVDAIHQVPFGDVEVYGSLADAPRADLIVDFSHIGQWSSTIAYAKKNQVPLVLGTTGYSVHQYHELVEASKVVPIFHSQNFSVGLYVVLQALKQITPMLEDDFDIEIIERHHGQKVDAPSGTTHLIMDTIQQSLSTKYDIIHGREGFTGARQKTQIGVHSIRGGSIAGVHEVLFASKGEQIQLSHTAESRQVFAQGALKAILFLEHLPSGLYGMSHLIGGITQ